MVGTSKILTVSYGTFSCTLEGFDDSFNTMKAIAEYFRGLAADDRYFGAEPPTPDAEMLAQIAEREISRRVDARMEDDGIVLRAAALTDQSDEADATKHDAGSRAKVEAARKEAKAARQAEKAAAKAERKAKKAAEKAAKEEARAKREAKKEAKEKADAEAKAEAEAKAKAEQDAKEAEEAKADATSKADAEPEPDAASEAPDDTDILSSVSAATAAATEGTAEPQVEETRDDAPSSMLAADGSVPAHPDADSVAAKLQRIRAVVGKADDNPSNDATEPFLPQSETPDVADVDALEAEAPAFEGDPIADLDAHEAELEGQAADTPEQDDASDELAETEEVAKGGTDMISRVMARHTPSETDPAEANEAAEVAKPDTPAQPRVVRMKRADFEKAAAVGKTEAPEPEAKTDTPEGPNLGLLDGADELDDYLEDSDFTDEDLGVNLDLIEETIAAETQADDTDAVEDMAETPEEAPVDAPEEIAAEHVEDAPEVAEDAASEEASDDADTDASNVFASDPQVEDAALDRLMSETDAQMQEPEGSRRRDAIAQLKAAVAAKEAARQVGEADDTGEDMENAFRNDLSEAVRPEGAPRPRPVVRSGTRTERPRPAPLKLVAAQRVDLQNGDKPATPVVPRRVAARTEEASTATGSFAEFAENMGASELPDLLEAAAAYTSFVEGADEFSRPQILRRVRAVASDDFNREDGLRSFADLLRAGRFTKVRNGRFQVADDSRFNPERQAS